MVVAAARRSLCGEGDGSVAVHGEGGVGGSTEVAAAARQRLCSEGGGSAAAERLWRAARQQGSGDSAVVAVLIRRQG